jgi:hypothetical protein
MATGPALHPPADAAGEAAALRAFASANDRPPTPAEHKLLRELAARFAPVAATAAQTREDVPDSGWAWLEAAVWEAVEAGSAFVAPRRLREILLRWEREGFPASRDPAPTETGPKPARASAARNDAPAAPRPLPAHFTVEEIGLSSGQVWAATLAEVARQGHISRADLETWLRPASLFGRAGQTLIVGAPNAVARDRIAARLAASLRAALTATLGVPVEIEVVYDEGDRVVG